jgi:hypothetical protein
MSNWLPALRWCYAAERGSLGSRWENLDNGVDAQDVWRGPIRDIGQADLRGGLMSANEHIDAAVR